MVAGRNVIMSLVGGRRVGVSRLFYPQRVTECSILPPFIH